MDASARSHRWLLTAAAAMLLTALAGEAMAQMRSADAHAHGMSALTVAQRGAEVEMEFVAPGADIVGFEHAAASEAEHALVADAVKRLEAPLQLFVFTPAIACTVASAEVSFGDEDDDHHHEHAGGHAEFVATYRLDCPDFARVTGIDFAIFDAFAGMEAIDVQLVLERGANRLTATRTDRSKPL